MKIFRLLIIIIIFLTPLSFGDEGLYAGRTEVGIHAGGIFFEQDVDGGLNLKEAFVYGARVGHYLTDQWAGEASFLMGNAAISGLPGDADVMFGHVEAQYHLGSGQLRPLFALGGGVLDIDKDGAKDETGFTIPWGLGAKWLVNHALTVRTDLRHLINLNSNKTMNHLLLTAGVSWLFGGTPAIKVKKPKLTDYDKDGVWDHLDRCPASPLGAKVDQYGCQEEGKPIEEKFKDSDGDGVFDLLDKCPGTAPKTTVNNEGCPMPKKVTIDIDIKFKSGWTVVDPQFRDEVLKVADFMKKHPKAKTVIEGHTDNVGSERDNQILSEQRAKSVRDFIVKEGGIDPARIQAVGYGSLQPVADNNTESGRRRNRRVVATITAEE